MSEVIHKTSYVQGGGDSNILQAVRNIKVQDQGRTISIGPYLYAKMLAE